ncbi:MAG: helix-turn-helix transcriptional regulator [Thermodesulfobacteriota bacterium]|nr:helix-turn-helix transcriptional regulator [Thermodesulfobacteriota bacterium]
MSIYGKTDQAIATDIGDRLKTLRLNKNYTQAEIAEKAGLSLKAVGNAEKGLSTLFTYIKILRVLKALGTLESFIPDIGISPLQLYQMAGKKRQRASKTRNV